MGGALEGLRVLDLTWGTAGPMTTMFLADNGADVIRIAPPAGDPFAGQTGYRVWNRGKRSAVLDLKADEGRARVPGLGGAVRRGDRHFLARHDHAPGYRPRGARPASTRASSPVPSPGTASTRRTATVPGTTRSSRRGRVCCSTRRDGVGRRWSSSTAGRDPSPSSTRPKAWSAARTATGPSFPGPSGRASVRRTSPRSASRPPCSPARSVAKDSA